MKRPAYQWRLALPTLARPAFRGLLYLGLSIQLCTTPSWAETKTYVVDLVMVTPTSTQWLKEEVFPSELPEPWLWFNRAFPITVETFSPVGPIDPISATDNPVLNAEPLSTHPGRVQQRLLERAQTRLTQSGQYRLLYQGSFVQEFKDLSQATRYWVQSDSQVRGQPELAGWITFYRGRFLHLRSQILLTQTDRQAADLAAKAQQPTIEQTLPLTQPKTLDEQPSAIEEVQWVKRIPVEHRQKLKSGETYYLDHPGLGILIKLSPLGT